MQIFAQSGTKKLDMFGTDLLLQIDNGNVLDKLLINNDDGTDCEAVKMNAQVGGVAIRSQIDTKRLDMCDCNILLQIDNGDIADKILINNDDGTSNDATKINSEVGGMQIFAQSGTKKLDMFETDILLEINNGNVLDKLLINNDDGTDCEAVKMNAQVGGVAIRSQIDTKRLDMCDCNILLQIDNGNVADKVLINNDDGTSNDAMKMTAIAGGVQVIAQTNKSLDMYSNTINLANTVNNANAVNCIKNQFGTTSNATKIQSVSGGVTATSQGNKTFQMHDSNILLQMSNNTVNDQITIENVHGTASNAVHINAVTGGMKLESEGDKSILMYDSNFTMDIRQGATDKILINNELGTDCEAIKLDAVSGGITQEASNDKLFSMCDDEIKLHFNTNSTTNATINVHNSNGTASNAICLEAAAGGVCISSETDFNLYADIINFRGKNNADTIINIFGTINSTSTTYTELHVEDKCIILAVVRDDITGDLIPQVDDTYADGSGLQIFGLISEVESKNSDQIDVKRKAFKWRNNVDGISTVAYDAGEDDFYNTDDSHDEAHCRESYWHMEGGAFRMSRYIYDQYGVRSRVSYCQRINNVGELEFVKIVADMDVNDNLPSNYRSCRRLARWGVEATQQIGVLDDNYGQFGDESNILLSYCMTIEGSDAPTAEANLENIQIQLQTLLTNNGIVGLVTNLEIESP
jgi:hypothetical protein